MTTDSLNAVPQDSGLQQDDLHLILISLNWCYKTSMQKMLLKKE